MPIAAAAAIAASAFAVRAETCQGPVTSARLIVLIDGVRSAKGLMTASLYPGDRSQFLIKNGALKVWSVAATAPQTRMCIWLKNGPGAYAVAVYHDANANGRWDHNPLTGIEGLGFSNNPRFGFSAPKYEAAKFQAQGALTTLHIRLRYP
jgi:uncharacterized protein (DUF2141 family)